jgi:hypothetical protein
MDCGCQRRWRLRVIDDAWGHDQHWKGRSDITPLDVSPLPRVPCEGGVLIHRVASPRKIGSRNFTVSLQNALGVSRGAIAGRLTCLQAAT